jgi:hypothetical protein
MLKKQDARAVALGKVSALTEALSPDDEIVILDDATIEREWGWVFFYTSKRWQETKDIRYALAGNAPIIINKSTGKLFETGTAYPVEHYIQAYERTGSPHG